MKGLPSLPWPEQSIAPIVVGVDLNAWKMSGEALATGEAGTVYLCHPFLVHAAQRHRGSRPRFVAQPGLPAGEPFVLEREDGSYTPVEQAIRLGLAGS